MLTVAGHDHQTAAFALGAVRVGVLFDSLGTAEALVRHVEAGADSAELRAAVAAVAARGGTVGRGVVPGQLCLLAGLLTGLTLERVCALVGAISREARYALGLAALDADPGTVRVDTGDGDELVVSGVTEAATPGALFAAALDRLRGDADEALAAVETLAGPPSHVVAAGGWLNNPAVSAAKRRRHGAFTESRLAEAGAVGAAVMAGLAAGALPAPAPGDVPRWADGADHQRAGPVPVLRRRRPARPAHPFEQFEQFEEDPWLTRAPTRGPTAAQTTRRRSPPSPPPTAGWPSWPWTSAAPCRRCCAGSAGPTPTTRCARSRSTSSAALSPLASGVLLDAEYGVGAVQEAAALAAGTGLLVAADPSPAQTWDGEHRTVYDSDRGPAWVRAHGGDALKFLVRWRHDRPVRDGGPDLAAEAFAAVRAVVDDCRAAGLASVVEPLVQPLPGETLDPAAKEALVVESARELAALRPDLLKIEWPGARGCAEVTAALAGVPWALLSAGVPFEQFAERVAIAVDAGAGGFIAGRAIWGEAVGLEGDDRVAFLDEVSRPRLARLVQVLGERLTRRAEVTA